MPGSMKTPDTRAGGARGTVRVLDDLDAVTAAVSAHGGKILFAKTAIPTVGVLTKFEDTEGNVLAAMKYECAPPH